MPHPLYNLWKNVILRNPRLAKETRDTLVEADLTPEERAIVEQTSEDDKIAVGKFGKNLYGKDVDTLGDAAEVEHRRSVEAQRRTTDAYNKDVVGSYKQAQKNAYQDGFFTQPDPRDDFINRVRSVAAETFERERKEEMEMVEDFMGAAYLSGRGNVQFALTGRGADAATLTRSLQGTGRIAIEDGSLTGVDVAGVLTQVVSRTAAGDWQVAAASNSVEDPRHIAPGTLIDTGSVTDVTE